MFRMEVNSLFGLESKVRTAIRRDTGLGLNRDEILVAKHGYYMRCAQYETLPILKCVNCVQRSIHNHAGTRYLIVMAH